METHQNTLWVSRMKGGNMCDKWLDSIDDFVKKAARCCRRYDVKF